MNTHIAFHLLMFCHIFTFYMYLHIFKTIDNMAYFLHKHHTDITHKKININLRIFCQSTYAAITKYLRLGNS